MRIILTLIIWIALYGMSFAAEPLSVKDFIKEYVSALKSTAPDISVKVKGGTKLVLKFKNGHETLLDVDNAYRQYRNNLSSKGQIIKHYVAATIEAFNPSSKRNRSRIVPVIKSPEWVAGLRQRMRGSKVRQEPIVEKLNDDLFIVYAEDTPRSIRYLDHDDLVQLKIKRGELKKLATSNLTRMMPVPPISARKPVGTPSTGIGAFVVDGVYEASLLAFDDIWSNDKLQIKGEIIVAVPNRGTLLFASSSDPVAVRKLRSIAAKEFRTGSYPISKYLYIYRKGKFVRYSR